MDFVYECVFDFGKYVLEFIIDLFDRYCVCILVESFIGFFGVWLMEGLGMFYRF